MSEDSFSAWYALETIVKAEDGLRNRRIWRFGSTCRFSLRSSPFAMAFEVRKLPSQPKRTTSCAAKSRAIHKDACSVTTPKTLVPCAKSIKLATVTSEAIPMGQTL